MTKDTKGTNPLVATDKKIEDALLRHREAEAFDPAKLYPIWTGYSSYFPASDVECNCGCGTGINLPTFNITAYNMLVHARVLAGVPFYVSSWVRCNEHNLAEGGSSTSSHLTGDAIDIVITNTINRFTILTALLEVGFNRIGIYPWGIHVDLDLTKPANVLWHGK